MVEEAPNILLSWIRKNRSRCEGIEAGKNAFIEDRKENVADEKGRKKERKGLTHGINKEALGSTGSFEFANSFFLHLRYFLSARHYAFFFPYITKNVGGSFHTHK